MKTFCVVDDDLGIVNILKDILEKYFKGSLVGVASTGSEAIEEIQRLKPDVILLDYLLPDKDGLQIVRDIREDYPSKIVMISGVSDKQMIAKAYREKIEFFITKPINVVEVVFIIKKIIEYQEIQNTLNQFEKAFDSLKRTSKVGRRLEIDDEQKLKKLYSKLGIVGTSGYEELIKAVIWAKSQRGEYFLSEMYKSLVKDQDDVQQIHTLKKRIGRAITKAFKTMASLGIEDYMNPIFESYSNQLFDFLEIRKEMKHLTNKSKQPGKINIKQFIESSIVLIEEM